MMFLSTFGRPTGNDKLTRGQGTLIKLLFLFFSYFTMFYAHSSVCMINVSESAEMD